MLNVTCRLSGLALAAVAAMAAEAAPLVRSGDVWVAIGDSITHGRRYHSHLHLFYVTRYPDVPFRLVNCGISGDSAAGAVQRFAWDIAVHRPTVATILLGMNDVARGLYAPGQGGEAVLQRRAEAIDAHVRQMTQLAELLSGLGTRIVFITPSIYDQTGTLAAENCVGVNDALAACGARLRELAPRFGAMVLDLHTPMTALNARLQEGDPALTLVGPDRVHPGEPGQLVMAYFILKALGADGTVARVAVDAPALRVVDAERCRVADLGGGAGGVHFTYLAEALPFPVHAAAQEALRWVPFMEDLNQETLRVTGLAPGEYTVLVDGAVVSRISADTLAAGINLAANPRSPMLRQAQAVLAAEEARHAIPAGRLRTFAAQRHWMSRRDPGLDPADFEAMKAALLADLETKTGASNYGYFKGQVDTYLRYKPQEADLLRQLEEHTATVWQLAKPVPRRVEIRPFTAADAAALE